MEPVEWLGSPTAQRFGLQLMSNQPRTKLHSQLDHGINSRASKIKGREPIRIHPLDAAARGILWHGGASLQRSRRLLGRGASVARRYPRRGAIVRL
jgi:hypothetical protein